MLSFQNPYLQATIDIVDDRVKIRGSITHRAKYARAELIAANPIQRMMNYSGSGLPWPCAAFAFQGTPNILEIPADGKFEADFAYPNSYYTTDGVEKVVSSVFAILYPRNGSDAVAVRMELPEQTPLQVRTLTYRPKMTSPTFYSNKEEIIGVRGAYDTMLAWRDVKIQNGLA